MKRQVISLCLILSMVVTLVMMDPFAYAQGQGSSIISATTRGSTFYIDKDHNLWGFGDNNFGQIGTGDKTFVQTPYKILGNVKSVATNQGNTFAVRQDGTLWCWGSNANSVFGNGTTQEVLKPIKIMDDVKLVSATEGYALVVKLDGSVWVSGANMPRLEDDGVEIRNQRTYVHILQSETFKYVSATPGNAYLINEADELWAFGRNNYGQLGLGHTDIVTVPVKMMDDVQYVAGNDTHVMIVRKDGALYMCGNNTNGVISKKMDNVLYAFATGGDNNYFAVKRDLTLWGWGTGRYIDQMASNYRDEPKQLLDNVTMASAGNRHIIASRSDRTLWTGGENYNGGILGKETNKTTRYPMEKAVENLIDTPSVWALAEVREAEYRKLVPPAMQADYTRTVTRSEFCTLAIILIEQANKMSIEEYIESKGLSLEGVAPFEDLGNLSERVRKDILAAYVLNIVDGTSATTFTPNRDIIRQEAAKMLTATAAALGRQTLAQLPVFADDADIANWSKPFIGYVFNKSIMTGVGNNRFSPATSYQRQQAYMTMLRLYKVIVGVQ